MLWTLPLALSQSLSSESVSTPATGLTLRTQRWSEPSNDVFVAEIDLCAAGVELVATEAPSSRRTAGSWGADVGATLAVNGDFYSGTSVYGDAVGEGQRWPSSQTGVDDSGSWYYRDYGWIGFGPDWVEFSHSGQTRKDGEGDLGWRPGDFTTEIPNDVRALVSGFPALVVEGEALSCSSPTADSCFPDRSDMRDRHPRTAMGLSQDRHTLYLVVVDGRSSRSAGAYGTELAHYIQAAGAWQAFNLDGGGSSQMWLSGTGYLNEPSDGSARSVANHWGLVLSGSSPASCHVEGGCFPTRVEGALDQLYKDLPPGAFGHEEAGVLERTDVGEACSSDPESFFCPACPMERATLVAWLAEVDGWDLSDPPQTPSFSDVDASHEHYAAVEEALRRGLTNGCGEGRFCPDSSLERQHAAAFVARTRGWSAQGPGSFDDVPESHAFYDEIQALEERCVVEACASGFCPDEDFTRAMAAVWLTQAWDLEDRNDCLGEEDSGGDSEPPSWWNESGEPGLGPGPRVSLARDCGCSGAAGSAWMLAMLGLYALRKRTS